MVIQREWILEWKFKIRFFLLTAVWQIQLTFINLHCHKLLQNIEIRMSCYECVYTWKILRVSLSLFLQILNLSLHGIAVAVNPRSLKKLKWHPRLKNHVSHWMDKIISEAVFTREKNCFWALRPLNEAHVLQVNTNTCLIDGCLPSVALYPASKVDSGVVSSRFIELILKVHEISASPVEIQDLKPLLAFGIPVVSIWLPMFSYLKFKAPLAPQNSKKLSMVWRGYFLESPNNCLKKSL